MKTFFSLVLLLFSFNTYIFSQTITFEKTIKIESNTDVEGFDVVQNYDSSYVIVGYLYDYNLDKYFFQLIKTNKWGDTVWTKRYHNTVYDDFGKFSIEKTPENGYIICGWTDENSIDSLNGYILKLNENGDSILTGKYGGKRNDQLMSIVLNKDSTFIVAGYTESFGNGKADVYVLKIDLNGNSIWTNYFGGIAEDWAFQGITTINENYVLIGSTWSYGKGNSDVYLIKLNAINGDTIWTKTYGTVGWELGHSIKQTKDKGYIICGTTSDTNLLKGTEIYLVKVDSLGNEQWTNNIPYAWDDLIYNINITDDGYIIGGTNTEKGFDTKISLTKTDILGNIQWVRNFDKSNTPEVIFDMIQTNDQGYALLGSTEDINGEYIVYFIKTDNNGYINAVNKLIDSEKTILIYPNPANDIIQFQWHNLNETNFEIKIYDILGKQIINHSVTPLKNYTTINIQNYKTGIYTYKFVSSVGKLLHQGKIIKQ